MCICVRMRVYVLVFNVLTGAFCWSVWCMMKTRALGQSVFFWISNVEGNEHFAWEKRFIQEVNKVYVVYLFICILSDKSIGVHCVHNTVHQDTLHSAPAEWRLCRVCVPVVHNCKSVLLYYTYFIFILAYTIAKVVYWLMCFIDW